MDNRSTFHHRPANNDPIYTESLNFNSFREDLRRKLKLKNWFVLTSHQHVHIFNVDKKANGNLAIRNTISIDTDLMVNVYDVNDDILSSLQLYSWPQLLTLIEQFSCNVNRGSDVFVVTVIEEEDQLPGTSSDVKMDCGNDQGTFEFCATNGDANDLQRLLGSIKVEPADDTLDWQDTLVHIKNEIEETNELVVEQNQLESVRKPPAFGHATKTVKSRIDANNAAKVWTCTTCDKEFSTKKKFRNHMYLHDRSKFKQCQICNATCFNMRRHIESVHKNVRKDVCHICGTAYKQLSSLKDHMESKHNEIGEYFCDICKNGKNYRSKGRLTAHIKNLHIKTGEVNGSTPPEYECNWCNQKLISRFALRIHVSSKHKYDRRYRCEICDKVFKRKQALVCHQILHSGKKFDCTECGQSFNHPDYLSKHRRQHKDIKYKE